MDCRSKDSSSVISSKDLVESNEMLGTGKNHGREDDKANTNPGFMELPAFPSQEEITEGTGNKNSGKGNSREEVKEEIHAEEESVKVREMGVEDNPSDMEADSVENGDKEDEDGFIKVDSRGRTRGATRMRERKTNEEEVPDCGPTIGGISGVTKELRGLLAEIGLKHVKVTPEGNCFYLAFSRGVYGKSNRWKEVRNRGAEHIENNREFYKGKLEEEEIQSTPAEMRKSGIFADDLSLLAVSEAYQRPIEVWRRTPNEEAI